MKILTFLIYSLTIFASQLMYANVVGSKVHPNKKKFSKTPIADSLKNVSPIKYQFSKGSQFDHDKDGIPDKDELRGISKYEYIKGDFTWKLAKSDAISKGGYLASISSKSENEKVSKESDKNNAWIGGFDDTYEGRWSWISGDPFKYKNWAKNRPNSKDNNDDFLEIQKDGKWNDTHNKVKQGYILEKKIKTNPNLADTDGDGYTDLVEIKANSDPRDRQSKPYDKKK